MKQLKTPVLLLIFNRPESTQQVFTKIRQAAPTKLFVAADGPRDNRPEDQALCTQTRQIIDQIDWPCEVKTLFRDKNLGCGVAPSEAITWFFSHVDQGIILEDDCVPHESFFHFCEAMLDYYKNDTRVMHIGGTSNNCSRDNSYYFTRIPRIWGWATWARAWKAYDFHMKSLPKFEKNQEIKNIFPQEILQITWGSTFKKVYKQAHKNPTVWDFQWTYTVLSQHGLCITPTKNLICNIGFNEHATHTTQCDPLLGNQTTEALDIEKLAHPAFILPNKQDEMWMMKHVFQIHMPNRIVWETKKLLKQKIPALVHAKRWLTKRIHKNQ